MIADVLSVYGSEVAIHRKTASNIGYIIGSLLEWWGDKTAADISSKTCRAYADTKSKSAGAQDLKILRAATNYWHKEYGPLNFQPVFWTPEASPPRDRWLTRNEAARLLKAAKPYRHLRRLILLGLYTGSRPGVILALQWDQIDFRNGVMSRLRPNATEDSKKRAPKVKLGRRILGHLRRWSKLDGGKGYVCYFEDEWHPGRRVVAEPHTAWRKVVEAAKLEGVTPHILRHTRATWMMQADVPIWEAAGFLGMTVKTLERVYGHHAPTHQERAANI
jgi:integrase